MTKSTVSPFIALVLVFTMVFQISSVIVTANNNYTTEVNSNSYINNAINIASDESVLVKGEIVSARNEYSKTFLLEDGTYLTLYASIPVHVMVNNVWQDAFQFESGRNQSIESVESSFNSVINSFFACYLFR